MILVYIPYIMAYMDQSSTFSAEDFDGHPLDVDMETSPEIIIVVTGLSVLGGTVETGIKTPWKGSMS